MCRPQLTPPENDFYRQELIRALEENRDLVKSYEILEHAVAHIILLEGNDITARATNDGFVDEATFTKYETLDSLLMHVSPKYMTGFNEKLTRKLEAFAGANQ